MGDDLKSALRLVWFGVALAMAVAVVTPFVVPAGAIQRLVPMCESKRRFGRECVLCGTTTGFIAISRGDFETASRSNVLAIPLFALFSANVVAAGAYVIKRAGAKRMR